MSQMLTVQQVADELAVSTDTVYGWIAHNHLPVVDLSAAGRGRPVYRIRREDLDVLLARRTRKPQPTPMRRGPAPARRWLKIPGKS